MFVICIVIPGDCKKYSLVKHNFLEGELYIPNEITIGRPDSQEQPHWVCSTVVRRRYLRPMQYTENAI